MDGGATDRSYGKVPRILAKVHVPRTGATAAAAVSRGAGSPGAGGVRGLQYGEQQRRDLYPLLCCHDRSLDPRRQPVEPNCPGEVRCRLAGRGGCRVDLARPQQQPDALYAAVLRREAERRLTVPAKTRNKSQRNQLQRPKRGTNQHDVVDTIAQNR